MQESRDSVADVWGERKPFEGDWPVRVDERTTEKPERWVPSACVLCSNGCGLEIGVGPGPASCQERKSFPARSQVAGLLPAYGLIFELASRKSTPVE